MKEEQFAILASREQYITLLNLSEGLGRRLRASMKQWVDREGSRLVPPTESNPAIALAPPPVSPVGNFNYSTRSKTHLATCHPALVRLFEFVLGTYDHVIIEGHRGKEAQNAAFDAGRSKLRWPDGKHNRSPSIAVDAAPYDSVVKGVNWDTNHRTAAGMANIKRFYHFAGIVQGIGYAMGIPIRWGGDWNTNTEFGDQTFDDLVHFELLNP